MDAIETAPAPRLGPGKPPIRYRLRGLQSATGQTFDGRYSTIMAALVRASALLREGYRIEIWSPASLEGRARSRRLPLAAPAGMPLRVSEDPQTGLQMR
jgi:hypothetical protein